MARRVGVREHNRVLAAAADRAASLEDKLTEILIPIFLRAGDVAAAGFQTNVTDHMTAAGPFPLLDLRAAAGNAGVSSNATMICVKPRPGEAEAIADPEGDPADRLHVTLVYLGQTEGPLEDYAEPLRQVAATHGPLAGTVGGYGIFKPAGVGILLPDVPGLVELRVAVTEALVADGIDYGRDHGFEAHMTVHAAAEPVDAEATLERAAGEPLHFDALLVVRGDTEIVEVPLVGVKPVTAAANLLAAASKPFCLPAELRTKTDPVRLSLIETVTKAGLKSAGLSFDVTNPFIDKVIAQTGKHIQGIAETTQVDVMRTIRASYDAGLSIPDTAKAIKAVMAEAAPVRARMIARTEMASAVNGASLAATQIVEAQAQGQPTDGEGEGTEGETGGTYKQWLTAPGAKFPRHEDYDDLDGQTVNLEDYFDVGDSQLQFPADPDGDAEEVINCRCTLVYTNDASELTASARRRGYRSSAPGRASRTAAELAAICAHLAKASPVNPPAWTAPMPEEVLPVSCAAPAAAEKARAVASEVPLPAGRMPVGVQTQAELAQGRPAGAVLADAYGGLSHQAADIYRMDSASLNDFLRKGTTAGSIYRKENIEEWVDTLREASSKLAEDTSLYRLYEADDALFEALTTPDTVLTDKGFMSTSTNAGKTIVGSGGVVGPSRLVRLEITAPAGSRIVWLNHPTVREVLLQPGSRLRIDSVGGTTKEGLFGEKEVLHVRATLLPAEAK